MDKNFFIKNKKKITIVVIAVAVLLIGFSLLNSTYSLFYHEDVASNSDNYSTGRLSITATGKGDSISLTNTLPMSDTEGAATTAYTFTIKNIGNLDYKFNVKLLSTGDSSTTIYSQYIKLKIDDGSVTTLSSLSNSIIKNNITLSAGQSIDISIRVWLSSDTPNNQIGKIFNSKIVTDGEAVYTSTNTKPTLAATISSLYNNSTKTPVSLNNVTYQYDTTDNLMADAAGNIRYYGSSPDNYIYFNCSDYSNQSSDTCEIWRIIGVFDGKVKIIRNEAIGSYSWDSSDSSTNSGFGVNEWSEADLMRLLNSGYENVGGSLYWNAGSGTCYNGNSNSTDSCDFRNIGLKNATTRNLISEETYYTRGYNDSSIYVDVMYDKERVSGTVVSATPTRSLTWTGKIALAYTSDYGYAADLSLCQKKLGSYGEETCKTNNWMYNVITDNGANWGWLFTPSSEAANYVWCVVAVGLADYYGGAAYAGGVTPVLSLNSELDIGSGSGTSGSPYQLVIK